MVWSPHAKRKSGNTRLAPELDVQQGAPALLRDARTSEYVRYPNFPVASGILSEKGDSWRYYDREFRC